MPSSLRKPTRKEKLQIIEAIEQGVKPIDIAEQLGVNPQSASGLAAGVRRGRKYRQLLSLAASHPGTPPMLENTQTPPQSQPTPALAPTQTQAAAAPTAAPIPASPMAPDGFGWRQGSGTFAAQGQTIRYTVERKMPPDGILGQHVYPFTEMDLGNMYGEGLYKLYRYDPGKPVPLETEVKIGPAFGRSRWPQQTQGQAERPRGLAYGQRDEEGERSAQRPPYYVPREESRDRALYEFARHGMANESAASEAIKQFGELSRRTVDQIETLRKSGPDSYMTEFFKEEQERREKQRLEELAREERRRKDDEEKWERRQKEAEAEYRRRQDEDQKRHERELEKIKLEMEAREKSAKAERDMLMSLEDKKLGVVREEAKLRQEALENELKRNREDIKELQQKTREEILLAKESTRKEIEDSRESLQEELEREREHLANLNRIKEKALDREHELNSKIIDIRQESISKEGGDQVFNMLSTVVKEFSKGLEKIVDLKKLEAMTPEAQAAAVAKGSLDGNVIAGPPKIDDREGRQQAVQARQTVAAEKPAGNGHDRVSAATEETRLSPEERMEAVICENIRKPYPQEILREWALHVRTGCDATTFANMYLEWMRDPVNEDSRKTCAAFASFMKPRDWGTVLKIIGPHLEPEIHEIFKTREAADFYEAFRAMVVEQIRDYWEQFLASRKTQQQQAARAPSAHASEERQANDEGVPVPSRETLRRQPV